MKFVINKNSKWEQPYWITIWSGSNVLMHSENYKQKASAISAARSIIENAGNATLEDNTGEA